MLPELMRTLVDALAQPTIFALLLAAAVSIIDSGAAIGERTVGLRRLAGADPRKVAALARRRIERADLLARVGPMLGLMGTLIPLGPGLAALGQGNVTILADAVTVAFDTTAVAPRRRCPRVRRSTRLPVNLHLFLHDLIPFMLLPL